MRWLAVIIMLLLSACATKPVEDSRPQGPGEQLLAWAEKLENEGSLQQAIVQIERTLRLEPNNAKAWYQLARVYYRKGEYDKARQFSLRSANFAKGDQALLQKNRVLLEKIEAATAL